jgi:hypothetical protein
MSEDNKMVSEKIDVLFLEGDKPMEYQKFIDKLDELYKRNVHLSYETFEINMTRVKELNNGMAMLFNGNRPETKDEKKAREAGESAKRKIIEEAELKEYMRLHKKYGKKNS